MYHLNILSRTYKLELIIKVQTYNFVPLVNVIRTGKQYTTSNHLAHYTTNRPNVDVLLITHTEYDFGCPVIPRHDVWRHHERRTSRPCQTKVQYFEGTVGFNNDIAGFQVLKRFLQGKNFILFTLINYTEK